MVLITSWSLLQLRTLTRPALISYASGRLVTLCPEYHRLAPLYVTRHYRMIFKRTGTKLPHVELAELGPRFDLKTDRDKAADHEKWK